LIKKQGTVVSASKERRVWGAIEGGTLPKGKYQNKKEVKNEK